MVNKKINYKKGASTVTNLLIVILITAGMFYGFFAYWADHATESGSTISSEYYETYGNVTTILNRTEHTIDDIQENVEAMESVDEGWLNAVWNGIKGLGNVVLLPKALLQDVIDLKEYIFAPLKIFPGWLLTLISIGIVGYVVFLLIRVAKGEQAF